MHLTSICRLFFYIYYGVAVKCKLYFRGGGLCTVSNKTKRGHQFLFVSMTGGPRFCLGLTINLASPPPP